MSWFVYMLCCRDGTLYTGATNDVPARLAKHQRGQGAKYTRARLPVTLAYQEELPGKSEALQREAALKRLTRQEKLARTAGRDRRTAMEMRRKDRQMPEEFAWDVADRCEYAFLSMIAEDGSPYGLPLTIAREGHAIYFHSAMEGRKIACLRAHPQVCMAFVGDTRVPPGEFTTLFASAVAFGRAAEVTEEAEKIHALELLCRRHTPDNMDAFDRAVAKSLPRTAVWRIDVEEITGKAKLPRKDT